MKEFATAVRKDLAIGDDIITDAELESLFKQVDVDGGGEVDAEEFVQWLFEEPAKKERSKRAAAIARLKTKFKEASASACEDIGWDLVFEKFDDDGSGELEISEFTKAVRIECGLSESAVPFRDIQELFGVIDADGSGAIDAEELKLLLSADLDAPSMTFGAFYSSMFELASLWSARQSEEQFCVFLKGLFDWISMPCNGHQLGEPGLDTLAIFDERKLLFLDGPPVANFKLKRLEDLGSMVGPDGSLMIDGFQTSGRRLSIAAPPPSRVSASHWSSGAAGSGGGTKVEKPKPLHDFRLRFPSDSPEHLRLNADAAGAVTLEIDVENAGQLAGDEVLQLYLVPKSVTLQHLTAAAPHGTTPLRTPVDFTRVQSLVPGATTQVEFEITPATVLLAMEGGEVETTKVPGAFAATAVQDSLLDTVSYLVGIETAERRDLESVVGEYEITVENGAGAVLTKPLTLRGRRS